MSTVKTALSVKGVSKSFKLPHERMRSLKSLFVNLFRSKTYEKQRVLRDISLEIKEGEFFGIVGRNGSGKSTLLKLLAGVYVPDEGTIEIDGKLTPFIELGVGFNPELSGRENVFLNGALLGFSRKEMEGIYDDIVAFAELERFMDQKLKNYSSGMQVRLAFSVAIQARTEILLIDEVLAVGDANFQQKCFDVFETFKKEGRTIVFVSHSMTMVKRFCDRAILIDKGRIKAEGEPDVVATEYEILNVEAQKENKDRLSINNRREAHIIDSVLENFDNANKLLEIGSANGRHVELLNSIGISTVGVDSLEKPNRTTSHTLFKSLSELKDPKSITGLLVLDNRKSINLNYLKDIFDELDNGKLDQVRKVYVHLPFHRYQEYVQQKDKRALSHLNTPLKMSEISLLLIKHNFIAVESDVYGTDQPSQYTESIFEKFDSKREASLWGS